MWFKKICPMTLQISPLQNIATERLILRPLEAADSEDIFQLRSNSEVIKYVNRPLSRFESEAVAFIKIITENVAKNQSAYWGIALPETNRIIGTICLWNLEAENFRGEIGYELMPAFQGKGYMQEAVKAVVDYGFNTLKLHTITAWFHSDNMASQKLLEKLGFKQEAYFKDSVFYNGKFSDMIVYTLFSSADRAG